MQFGFDDTSPEERGHAAGGGSGDGRNWRDVLRTRLLACVAGAVALLVAAPACAAAEFNIRHAEIGLSAGVFHVNADIEYSFTAEALEALENGVPLTLKLNIVVERARDYLWNERVAKLTQRFQLKYHALTRKYVVQNLNSGEQRSHANLAAAVASLGHIETLPILDRALLDPNGDYQVRLQAVLDINALPAPMRPLAWLTSGWRLSSEWYVCPLIL